MYFFSKCFTDFSVLNNYLLIFVTLIGFCFPDFSPHVPNRSLRLLHYGCIDSVVDSDCSCFRRLGPQARCLCSGSLIGSGGTRINSCFATRHSSCGSSLTYLVNDRTIMRVSNGMTRTRGTKHCSERKRRWGAAAPTFYLLGSILLACLLLGDQYQDSSPLVLTVTRQASAGATSTKSKEGLTAAICAVQKKERKYVSVRRRNKSFI